jgi:DNA-binding transcriptional regulator YdaS (Cro superfamily)
MAEEDSYARCVRHAVGIVGSPEALAVHLGVDAELVNRWSSGTSVPTATHFSRIVDIIVGKTAARELPKGRRPSRL